MKRILVTGGTGFIGSHTAVALMQAGYEVVIVDNLANSFMEVVDGIEKIVGKRPEFHQFDISEKDAFAGFMANAGHFDGIIHFAAYKAVGESVEMPLKYYQNNLYSLINLLESMEAQGVKNLVFSSSCTVYGEPDSLPVTEHSPVKKPESPYGNTKRISEEIIEDVTKTGKVRAISLRYFNPIGAHPSGLIGEIPIGVPNNLMPVVTQTAIGKRGKVTVYGNDYPTPDGTCIRDYIHVVDLAKAHVTAVERMISDKGEKAHEIFNVGTGRGYTVLEVIKAFEKISGMPLNYEIGERRPGDVSAIYADTSFANATLGWQAVESLENMVETAWKWEQNIPKIYGDRFA